MCHPAQLRVLLAAFFCVFCLATAATAQDRTLQLNQSIERKLGPSDSHSYTVTLEENTFAQLVVEQRGIDAIVKVSSPAGKNLGDFDSPNGADGPENVSFVAVTAGAYRIIVAPLTPGDTSSGQYHIKLIEVRQATEEEIKTSKNLEVVKVKAIELFDEIEGMIQEIRAPHMRIRSQLQAAQMLWDFDQKRATKYLTSAANSLKGYMTTLDPASPDYARHYSTISQLRTDIVHVLSGYDPDAALNLLYATKLPGDPHGNQRDLAAQENALELAVANQMLANDPKRAVQLARQNLKHGYAGNLVNTISNLRQKNPELATELATEIAGKLLREKLLKKPEAAYLTTNIVRLCFGAKRRVIQRGHSQGSNGVQVIFNGRDTGVVDAEPVLSEATCRDLVEKSLREALSYTPPGPNSYTPERDAAWSLLNGLQQLGANLDTTVAGASSNVEKKLAELNAAMNPHQQVMHNVMVKLNGSPEAAFESIEKAPPEMRDQLYIQMANMASQNGDPARARQILNEHVKNAYQLRQALANLEQQEMYQAVSRGKVEEALRTISALRTPRERANMLMQIMRQIGPGQKRASALNFLEQARALLSPEVRAQDQEQMNALLEIARAFSRYDVKRAFEIVDPLVEQLNELCAAARTLEGFGTEAFEEDEMDLHNGNTVASAATQLTSTLGSLAIVNFERAKLTADRLRLPEVRLRGYLDIAQQTLQASR
ncbi:MAG: PPC domain-containing protein [Acidobacteria bacterium]|nr:PPC domain-containing protein [Acidobacteriota bacterium]